ncbi:formylmethanofuran dehydrogenase subunit B [Zavarzinella formosa]|uniref:formylmethanofuran dehydrogenase subunit B n=1 Tax=Zavarzinella formosa TaxID=360055 RepID=UPI0002F2E9CE|nr:formylmethanofuran dehydrogenase subunit B [Zavarzinella formosa]
MKKTLFQNVPCTVCGCVCDDLSITVEGGRITSAEGACDLARPRFLEQNAYFPPVAEIRGESVPLDEAITAAVAILRQAKSPLIYGLSRSTTEGQRAAVALAELVGATIDTTAATGHAPSLMALQQVGESTCSLGEVKSRADLVIYWGCDPLTTHPRHVERYAPPRPGRTIVAVDVRETATSKAANSAIRLKPESDWEALWTLRALVKGVPMPEASPELAALANQMKLAKFGVVFFGGGLIKGALANKNVEALLQLVTDLNDHTRFYARRMRRFGDIAGADSVLTWQTGYPFGVNFSKGYPRFNPGEFSAPAMLARREVDACLFVGSETSAEFPPEAIEHLKSIPVIALEAPNTVTMAPPAVRFTTAVYGVHRPGTAYRMDEIPIPLQVLLPTHYPSDGEVMERLHSAILAELSGDNCGTFPNPKGSKC